MLVESLKQIVSQFNTATAPNPKWTFKYGKDYWQNRGDYPPDELLPFVDRQKYLFLLWKDRGFAINKHGAISGTRYDGEMVLLVRSKFSDPTYDYKYETHIKNLEAESERVYNAFSDCDGWTITAWKETEVENEYDTNMDGLKIKFTIEYE
ncbi:hypothetical protein [Flavobacterium sp. 3-210]